MRCFSHPDFDERYDTRRLDVLYDTPVVKNEPFDENSLFIKQEKVAGIKKIKKCNQKKMVSLNWKI